MSVSNGRAVIDPDAVLDFTWDWAAWLRSGETITAHTLSGTTGITVGASSATTTSVTCWISGAVLGSKPAVTCHITTSAGREDDRTLTFTVMER